MFPEHPPTREPPRGVPSRPATSRRLTHHPAERTRKAIAVGAAATGIGLVGVFAVTTDVGASSNPPDGHAVDDLPTAPALGFPTWPDGHDGDRLTTPGDSFGANTWSTPALPSTPGPQADTRSRGS